MQYDPVHVLLVYLQLPEFTYASCLISSISPISGPTTGGTTVTLTGSDLGVAVEDVVEVSFGASSCAVGDNFYIPGDIQIPMFNIICVTTYVRVCMLFILS